MTSTCKRYSPHLTPFIELVESGKLRTSKEIKALVEHVKRAFDTEEIYVDNELADKYIGMAKYFPFDQVFPWEEFVITLHLCTFERGTGMPRWPDVFCLIGRGAGKDGLIALESVCVVSPYHNIWQYDVDICANNEEQALRPVLDIVEAFEGAEKKTQAKLKKYFSWKKESVDGAHTCSKIRGRTNNPKGKDGMRSGMVVFNEVHAYENYNNISVFTTGLGKKKNPRRLIVTTNGDVREGPLDDYIETSEGILFGGDPDNGWLPFICRLDNKKEIDDQECWEKANPSLPYLPSLKREIEKEYGEWKKNPERNSSFVVRRMNLSDGNSETKVTAYENIKATKKDVPDLSGWQCTVGIDFAKITDWVSVDFHFKQGKNRYDLSHSWICSESKDIPRLKVPWKAWAEAGRLTVVDEVEIHPEMVVDYIYSMKEEFVIKGIAIDDFRYALLSRQLKEIGFDPKEKKNLKLVRPADVMRVAPVIDSCFANQSFIWGDAPELRWAVNNTKLIRYGRKMGKTEDADLGNYVYGKIEAKSRKTDPFMALVAAMTIEDMIIERRAGKRRPLEVGTY